MTTQDAFLAASVACFVTGGILFAIAARYFITRDIWGVHADLAGKARRRGTCTRRTPVGNHLARASPQASGQRAIRGIGHLKRTSQGIAQAQQRPQHARHAAAMLPEGRPLPDESDRASETVTADGIPTEVTCPEDTAKKTAVGVSEMSKKRGFVVTRHIVCVHADVDAWESSEGDSYGMSVA